jgi:transposase
MPVAISEDLRLLIVRKHYLGGQAHGQIAKDLAPCSRSTVKRVLRRWRLESSVASRQGKRQRDPANTVMSNEVCMLLLERVTLLDDESMLTEIHEDFMGTHGVEVSLSTICRAMARLGFTRKKLHRLALECDRRRADQFYADVTLNYSAPQLLFLDETSKDDRAFNRSFGYELRGLKPRSSLGVFQRGQRFSTLAAFDMTGFLGWYSIRGTFKADNFLDGIEDAIIQHVGAFPGPRSVAHPTDD